LTHRLLAAVLGLMAVAMVMGCRRTDARTPEQLQARIDELRRERAQLRARHTEMLAKDPRLAGMPGQAVRVGVPTPLARKLVQRVLGGFVDSVTLTLADLKVRKLGKVKKLVNIGEYELKVVIEEVTGKLETGEATIGFGDDQIRVTLPVRLVSGTGDATIDFNWDGKNLSGAVCGDMAIQQKVSGRVKPEDYSVSGALMLTATARQILASPKFPVVKINLKVEPSAESWAAVQKVLDERGGVCGFVLDKVDIAGVLEGLVAKGFNVRLPTERIKPRAIPVGIAPTLTVRGEPLTIAVKVGHLAITEHMIWLGADVALGEAAGSPSP
jgi:hypothetical protein